MWIASERRRAHRWIVPAFAAAVGVAVGATLAVRGDLETGLVTLAVLLGYGVLLGSRGGETAGGGPKALSVGRGSESHSRAAAVTGDVLMGVIVAAVLVQALRGAEIWVLAGLAGIAGVTYLLSIAALSWY
jgi:hypothetical protein